MESFGKVKRVTDPLDEQARARLVGAVRRQLSYVSSGSEHDGSEVDVEVDDSPMLSQLVQRFLEPEDSGHGRFPDHETDSDRVDSDSDSTDALDDILTQIFSNGVGSYRNDLLCHVSDAIEAFASVRSNKPVLRRRVMIYLRDMGYNAAICKTRWPSSGSLIAGSYEFIDVVGPSSSSASSVASQQSRYFVDLDFAGEFEIARPTSHYAKMLRSLPKVFVGDSDELKTIVKVMGDEAKRSLKSRELSLPPWRRCRYMQSKWLGPYRRTVNPDPVSSFMPANGGVKCRRVGFDGAIDAGCLSVRTR